MKTLFWILLLANAALFAAMQWGGGAFLAGEQVIQPQPALNKEKIRLLDASEIAMETTSAVSDTVTPAPDASTCMEWGDFAGTDLARATTELAALKLGDKLSRRQVEHSIGYWVYVPPLKDKAAVNQKVAQLKARGVKEYFVVAEAGQWLNAISLGVFKTQEAAQVFLEELRAKDVRSAQMGERASKFKTTVFVLNGPDAATADKLSAMQKDFPGSELKNIPCPH